MKISTSIRFLQKIFSVEQSMELLANAGFTAQDQQISLYDINWNQPPLQDHTTGEFKEYFRNLRRLADSYGLEIFQGHAPYAYSGIADFAVYERMKAPLLRSIYAAGEMGCPNMVVHPVILEEFTNGQNPELAKKTIMDYYSEFVPALKDTGVTLCMENLFRTSPDKKNKLPTYGSFAPELVDLIDSMNQLHGPYFAACVDTGHCNTVNGDLPELVKTLGHRLRVLHVHDNDGIQDLHLPPREGTIDWPAFMQALRDISYQGTFNFETSPFFQRVANEDPSVESLQAACHQLYALGEDLLRL